MTLWPRMQAITLEIILQAVFGLEEGPRLDALREPPARGAGRQHRPRHHAADRDPRHAAGSSGWAWSGASSTPPTSCCSSRSASAASDPDLESRSDILSMLLSARYEDGEPMSDFELRDELMTLLVAGHETTATSLAWTHGAPGAPPRRARAPARRGGRRRGRVPGRGGQGDAAAAPGAPRRGPPPVARTPRSAGGCCPPASPWRPASTWCTAARTSTPSPRASGPSASSSSPPAPTRGSRSAAACAAAWAPASRCSR